MVMKHRNKCYLCPDLTSSNTKPKTQNLFQYPGNPMNIGSSLLDIGYSIALSRLNRSVFCSAPRRGAIGRAYETLIPVSCLPFSCLPEKAACSSLRLSAARQTLTNAARQAISCCITGGCRVAPGSGRAVKRAEAQAIIKGEPRHDGQYVYGPRHGGRIG